MEGAQPGLEAEVEALTLWHHELYSWSHHREMVCCATKLDARDIIFNLEAWQVEWIVSLCANVLMARTPQVPPKKARQRPSHARRRAGLKVESKRRLVMNVVRAVHR